MPTLPNPVGANIFCFQEFFDLGQCHWASVVNDPQLPCILGRARTCFVSRNALLLVLVRDRARFTLFALFCWVKSFCKSILELFVLTFFALVGGRQRIFGKSVS